MVKWLVCNKYIFRNTGSLGRAPRGPGRRAPDVRRFRLVSHSLGFIRFETRPETRETIAVRGSGPEYSFRGSMRGINPDV